MLKKLQLSLPDFRHVCVRVLCVVCACHACMCVCLRARVCASRVGKGMRSAPSRIAVHYNGVQCILGTQLKFKRSTVWCIV